MLVRKPRQRSIVRNTSQQNECVRRVVRIRDSYLHHNRHRAGEGYGTEVVQGAYAPIDRNRWDFWTTSRGVLGLIAGGAVA